MSAQGISPTIPAIFSPTSLNRTMAISSMSAASRATVPSPPSQQQRSRRRTMSALEARISLVFALASQTSSVSQRLLADLVTETAKYVFPKRFESRTLEEALMSVPDLETVNFRVLSRTDQYEIREVEPYFIAETTMPGRTGFDFNGASVSFNVLAEYLFGKNTAREKMEMTTPVITRKAEPSGERMEMTTPVITKKVEDQDKWQMSFVMPSKYGGDLPLPKDPSVRIKEVPRKTVAVVAFSGIPQSLVIDIQGAQQVMHESNLKDLLTVFLRGYVLLHTMPGFVTDEEGKQRETKLREALKNDRQFQMKDGASVEVAQYNPPFTLPFQRRNEIALEVEKREK